MVRDAPIASKAWYALRRTLPPWSFKENLAELVELCPLYGIDEVIVKVDTEDFSHGHPTLKWAKSYQSCLFQTKEELKKIGVLFSINPWVTLVHRDQGRDCSKVFPDFGFMVGHDGTTCIACVCPLSEGWRSYITKLWKIYAETEPEVLWVEDDFRTYNHMPVRFGCFCQTHLERFGKKIGKEVSQEALVQAILSPGRPHPYRKLWLDLQGEIMIETASLLEKAVHSISPGTRLGLMSSDPARHAFEGRQWHRLAKALSGAHKLFSRPSLSNYQEISLRDLYYSVYCLRLTRHCLPEEVIIQTEVENAPFTQYSKSTRFTFLQMALSFALGADGVTLNLFDHCGTPMKSDPSVGEMLSSGKPFLSGIVEKCLGGGASKGVQILHHTRGSDYMVLDENADCDDLIQDGYAWQTVLESLGFGTTFEVSDLIALSGQTVRAFGDEEVKSFLAKGVLIDVSALRILVERGFGEFLGVSIKREFLLHGSEAISAEEFFEKEFGGKPLAYMTLSIRNIARNADVGELILKKGARMLSRMVDPDGEEKYPFLTIFENKLGGRIAIYPVDINEAGTAAFLHPPRQRQLYNVLKWLSRDKIPLFVEGGVYPLLFRSDHERATIIGIFNLCLDEWPHARIHMHVGDRKVSSVDILQPTGEWIVDKNIGLHQDNGNAEFGINKPISFKLPMIISVNYAV